MAIPNKTRYAILGVLYIKPSSGYDIKKFCDKTISHFWNENFGHIYPVLKQLETEGLIKQTESQTEELKNTERRKLYDITEEGKQVFHTWLQQATMPQPPRSELLLKLSFGNHLPKDQVLEMLQEVKERNSRNLEQYKSLEKAYRNNKAAKSDPAYPYWLAPLRLGILNTEATLTWCDETIQLINEFVPGKN